MRYGLEVVDGVELTSGSTPLPPGAIEPIPNWDDISDVPAYYLKVVDGQIVEKTQAEKDAYDEAHPPTTEQLQEEARQYLLDTDWYIVRQMDNGTPCPQEVKDAREAARDLL